MPLKPDETILNGKYRIQRLIGEGGMARVWLAEELTFGGRQVALKEPRDDLLSDLAQEVRLRYQREVQVCAALDKARVSNIVRAFTAEPYEDTVLLAMEYMPGGDLAALLKQYPEGLPVERAVSITLNVLAALEGVHDHELEIVHRDVKPSNILFDKTRKAYLADFGLAQLASPSAELTRFRGGGGAGTIIYMAPEQESNKGYLTPAADLYALGCVLFEMLTGQRYKRVRPGTLPSALRAQMPGWLDEIVARSLIEDPWDRYVDAAEMAAAMREAEQRAEEMMHAFQQASPEEKTEVPGKADELLDRLKTHRHDYSARLALARLHCAEQGWDEALAHYEKLISASRFLQDVVDDLESLVDRGVQLARVYQMLADAHMQRDELDEALAMYRLARQELTKR